MLWKWGTKLCPHTSAVHTGISDNFVSAIRMCCPSGMCVESYVHAQNPFHNWLCQIESNHYLSSCSKKSSSSPASSFYWEKGQACWMHSGLWECAIWNPSWKGHGQVGTSGQAVLGSQGLEGHRQSTCTKQRALAWHWNSRWSCGLGPSLHFHFYTFNGETNTFQHALPFVYSALPTPHVFMGYTATEGVQRSSNVTSWKTFHLTFKRSQRNGKDLLISNS